jgi:hypothetical protein
MRPTAAVDAHRRSPTASLLLLLLGVALLLGAADAKKKSPAKKVGFLKTTEKRSKYATWVFEQYDEDGNGKLTEAEIDTANDEEPPVQIQKDVEDTLELFDLDLLDKDPVDLRVSRAELLAKLEDLEERRLSAIETWCGRRLASSQPALLLRAATLTRPLTRLLLLLLLLLLLRLLRLRPLLPLAQEAAGDARPRDVGRVRQTAPGQPDPYPPDRPDARRRVARHSPTARAHVERRHGLHG